MDHHVSAWWEYSLSPKDQPMVKWCFCVAFSGVLMKGNLLLGDRPAQPTSFNRQSLVERMETIYDNLICVPLEFNERTIKSDDKQPLSF